MILENKIYENYYFLGNNMKEEIQNNESNGGYEESGPLSIDTRYYLILMI